VLGPARPPSLPAADEDADAEGGKESTYGCLRKVCHAVAQLVLGTPSAALLVFLILLLFQHCIHLGIRLASSFCGAGQSGDGRTVLNEKLGY